jgi:ubiquitin-like-conjugating enzyme ATG3
MTMEPFPHSGQQLASVHPCKHASVMKKFIDRMDEHQSSGQSAGPSSAVAGKKGGAAAGKWGLGGMVRKVTGGSGVKKDESLKEEESEGGEPRGLQVDFYLVIVGRAHWGAEWRS